MQEIFDWNKKRIGYLDTENGNVLCNYNGLLRSFHLEIGQDMTITHDGARTHIIRTAPDAFDITTSAQVRKDASRTDREPNITDSDLAVLRTIKKCLSNGHNAEIHKGTDGSPKVFEVMKRIAAT